MRFLLLLTLFVLFLVATSACTSWRIENRHPAIGEFVAVDGERLHYLELGEKSPTEPTLVILHGSSANLKDTKLALGDTLAKNHHVILFDRPGRGYSTRPENGYLLDVQARLMHDALVKLGVENPIVIGQSLGGAAALAYTLRYQDEMSGAVLLAPVSHEWPGGVVWYNNVSSKPISGFLLRRTIIPHYGRMVAKKSAQGAFWPQPAPDNYYERAGIELLFRPKEFINNAADVAHLKPQIIEMSKRYNEIDIPVKIYAGAHDTTVSPTIHSYNLSQDIPNAEFTLLPAVGHGLHHSASVPIIAGIEALILELQGTEIQPEVTLVPEEG